VRSKVTHTTTLRLHTGRSGWRLVSTFVGLDAPRQLPTSPSAACLLRDWSLSEPPNNPEPLVLWRRGRRAATCCLRVSSRAGLSHSSRRRHPCRAVSPCLCSGLSSAHISFLSCSLFKYKEDFFLFSGMDFALQAAALPRRWIISVTCSVPACPLSQVRCWRV